MEETKILQVHEEDIQHLEEVDEKDVPENAEIVDGVEIIPDETSNLFMLEEMVESMQKSLENGIEVANGQDLLISIVEAANNEKMQDFVVETKKANERMRTNLAELERRMIILREVCQIAKTSKAFEELVSNLCDGLGVFSR